MTELALARVVHVVAVVLWIGGVAMVTTVLLPAVKRFKSPEEAVAFFERVEARFAWQSRITTLLAGASGFYMLHLLGWQRLWLPGYWWLHAMIAVWLLFTLMLFVFEPLFLHRWFNERAERAPQATFRLIHGLHWGLLTVSLITVAGAVAGSHGWFWW
ncbi:hypothetical protein SAMN02745148_00188 [Modicisalibacter ilicicola DSM 19980]|uniref:Copper resistance protein D n=1 Tax=Modicisalibacter ilicicola DSM 19980 TaxID=1121942 RepID=A0A1M4SQ29_9GAMM|nr:hypothetical protein [Halomonas ilicicola]SHE34289.1 hypothetical protein SAMN02745148_00188 [Halomonas ilicicola DSM 19980]